MKVVICGDKQSTKEMLHEAIEKSGVKISAVYLTQTDDFSNVIKDYCEENLGITPKLVKPDWKDISVPGAVVKTGQYGKYNAMAAKNRDKDLISKIDDGCVIAIQPNGECLETMIVKEANANKVKVIVYPADVLEKWVKF